MELRRPSSVADAGEGPFLAGGTELVPLLRSGIVQADALVDIRGVVPRGIDGTRIGAGATLAELEVDPQVPEALREACRLAAIAAAAERQARSRATCCSRRAAGTGA